MEAPRHDCLEEEEEEDQAKLLPRLDLLQAVPIDGGERRHPLLGFGHGAARFRVSGTGEKEGREREQGEVVVGILLTSRGEQVARHGTRRRRHGASAIPGATVRGERELTRGGPTVRNSNKSSFLFFPF